MIQPRFTWLLLLILPMCFASCNKKTAQYDFVIICRTPLGAMYAPSDDADLVVTDAEGHILGAFDIGAEEAEFQRVLRVDEDIKTCNIHLGFRRGSSPSHIYSHLDVQSGSLIVFEPSFFIATGILFKQKSVQVNEIQSLDSLGFLGGQTLYTTYGMWASYAGTSMLFLQNQGAIMHGRANGQSDYRYLYLSDSLLGTFDKLYETNWWQFKPVPAPRSIALSPAMPLAQELFVDAISPDFQHFVSVGPGNHIDPSNIQFIQPKEVPLTLRVRLNGLGYATEKIFQPGEPLQFSMTDMQIGNISYTLDEKFKIELSGDIDLLEVTRTEPTYYTWKIQGNTGSFRDLTLPTLDALSRFIPIPSSRPTPFGHGTVRAYQFGKHNYPEVREGFPLRSTEPFALARSGYFMIEKWF